MDSTLISARWLLLDKFVTPTLWLVGFWIWTIVKHFDPCFRSLDQATRLQCFYWVLLVLLVVRLDRYHLPLKQVRMVRDGLWVSNSRTEIHVPFSAIASVFQPLWFARRYVVVRLRDDSPFGRRFTFLPAESNKLLFFCVDDVVTALRRAVKSERVDSDPA
ncbi:MAG: hypothetical protein ABI353_23070 [Isosphaeraceae bacterium]